MIYFENVSKHYNDIPILKDINLIINKGEFVNIVGHSGAGKSTLIRLLLAEDKPTVGKVSFYSADVHKLSGSSLNEYRRKIGPVFQDFRLVPHMTAFENISFAMEVSGKTDRDIRIDVPHVLDLVDLKDKMNYFPDQLSGGEQQRVAIARALVNRPDIIIADEPTGNLDPENTYDIVQILKKINDLGTTVILTTHNNGIVENVGRRVLTMERGEIIKDEDLSKNHKNKNKV
ncbi:MAG: cell division ATP-binding protein FtsE [Candidatus Pacebacteria bacterium]|nr:cell division ATP-binding protein FtsE [Candidatus Paceibacterota bacterium]